MRIFHRVALVGSFLLVCLTCSSQAEPVVETIDLEHIRPDEVTNVFTPAHEPASEDGSASHERVAVNFALGALARVARLRPREQPQVLPVQGACEAVVGEAVSWTVGPPLAPTQRRGTAADLLPEGLDGPPEVAPGRNAVTVKGAPEAIDEFREIVSMLDAPRKMAQISVRAHEVATSGLDAIFHGIDEAEWSQEMRLRLGLGNLGPLPGVSGPHGPGRTLTQTQVIVANGEPAIISVGEILPLLSPLAEVSYDAAGERHVRHDHEAALAGISLWVLPQINPDDTVGLYVRALPVAVEGKATDTAAEDISCGTPTELMVRVRNGESLVLAGFGLRQRLNELSQTWPTGEPTGGEAMDSLISITPRIITSAEE